MDIITLIKELVTVLLDAEEKFLKHLETFSAFEESVHGLTDRMSADFLVLVLTNVDTLIRGSGKTRCLLDELIRLPDRERLTPAVETVYSGTEGSHEICRSAA